MSDTGKGIDRATAQQIFEPLFKTKTPGYRSGLSFSVLPGSVEGHPGGINVSGGPARGTTFQIYLPTATAPVAAASPPTGPVPRGQRQHILVIDDESSVVTIEQFVLQKLGYRITVCTDSRQAMDILKAEPGGFDLVLTDLSMPHFSGLDIARQIHAAQLNVPVLVTSGNESLMAIDESIPIAGFVAKPTTIETLGRAVHRSLNQKRRMNRCEQSSWGSALSESGEPASLDNSIADRVSDHLGIAAQLHLFKNAGAISADGFHANAKSFADLGNTGA